MKKVGAIIIGLLLGVLLLMVSFEGLSKRSNEIKQNKTTQKKTEVSKAETKKTTEQKTTQVSTEVKITETPEINVVAKTENEVDVYMKEIDINSIPYTNNLKSVEVSVSQKHVFIDKDTLFYCVELLPKTTNCDVEKFVYYVSYSAYNSLSLGDICTLEYENVNNGLVSIYSLKKN